MYNKTNPMAYFLKYNMLPEVEYVTANTLTDRINNKVVLTTANVCRIGLNNPSNRLRSVSNVIEKRSVEFAVMIWSTSPWSLFDNNCNSSNMFSFWFLCELSHTDYFISCTFNILYCLSWYWAVINEMK